MFFNWAKTSRNWRNYMDRSHILFVVRFRARSSLNLILTSAGPEMCRVVVGLTYCNKGNTPFVRNVKETKWATLPRHSTVIPIAKKCPKNQILSENISKASIYSSQVTEVHFSKKILIFFIFIIWVHFLTILPYELQENLSFDNQ